MVKLDLDTRKIYNNEEEVGNVEIYKRKLGEETYLTLSKIFIYPEHRGNKYADEAMNQLIDYCDKNKIVIILTPSNAFGASEAKLRRWYSKFGFILNKGKNKDFKHMELMYRVPI